MVFVLCYSVNSSPDVHKRSTFVNRSSEANIWILMSRLINSIFKCRIYGCSLYPKENQEILIQQSSSFLVTKTIDDTAVPYSSSSLSSSYDNEDNATNKCETIAKYSYTNCTSTITAGCKVDLQNIISSNYCNRDNVINDYSNAITVYRVEEIVV